MTDLMDTDLVAFARAAEAANAAKAKAAAADDTDDVEADVSSTYMPRSSARAGAVLPAAGWYTDPKDSLQRRWWDGSQWTNHVRPIVSDQIRFQQPSAQVRAADARSTIQGLAADIGGGQPVSRFAPGGPQPEQSARGRHSAMGVQTLAPAATPVAPATASWAQLPTENRAAKVSFVFGVFSIIVPVILPSIIAFIIGGVALGRAGHGALAVGRNQASWAIALGVIGLAVAATAFAILLKNPAFAAAIGVATS